MPPRGKTPLVVPWTKVTVEYGQFQDYILKMLEKSSFKDSFLPNVDMNKYEEYTVYRFSETEEEIVLGIDKNTSQRKVIIFAMKSALDTVENFLKSCCDHLWEHDNCT